MGRCLAGAWHCAGRWAAAACGREEGAALQAWVGVGVGVAESHYPKSAGYSRQPVHTSLMSLSTWQGGPVMNTRHCHLSQLCPATGLFQKGALHPWAELFRAICIIPCFQTANCVASWFAAAWGGTT